MSIVKAKWKDGLQCRIENGIFFPNDEYIALSRNPNGSFDAAPRLSIQELIEQKPDCWTQFYVSCEYSDSTYTVFGGDGAWEGDGFVCLVKNENQELQWILHLDAIENVQEIVIEAGVIQAVSLEYPTRLHFTIPVETPQKISVVAMSEH